MRLSPLLFTALLAAACSTAPQRPAPPAAEVARGFQLTARFAARQESPSNAPRSVAGRLDWRHDGHGDRVIISDPLSRGIAELRQDATGASLTLADGRTLSDRSAEALLQQTLGFSLPITPLAGWLRGDTATTRDAQGRARTLTAPPWQIDYFYNDDQAASLPARLTIRHTGNGDLEGLELKLRIEEWNTP